MNYFNAAYLDFLNGPSYFFDGMSNVASAMFLVRDFVAVCLNNTDGERFILDRMAALVFSFSNPWTAAIRFAYEIFWNGDVIYSDINLAVTAWENDNFYEFGKLIGQVCSYLVPIVRSEPAPLNS